MRIHLTACLVAASYLAGACSLPDSMGPSEEEWGVMEPVGAGDLLVQGWKLLPVYVGAHRYSMGAADRAGVLAAIGYFERAVELEPENVQAWQYLAHAHILLGEDRSSRGDAAAAEAHFDGAEMALERALGIDARDQWCLYSTGTVLTSMGRHGEALAAFGLARMRAEELELVGERFKAMEWECEAAMRAGKFGRARYLLGEFHGEYSTNGWPLEIALAECAEREGDFDRAAEAYGRAIELFPNDDQAYALLGYLDGLRGDLESATRHLNEALVREPAPTMYTRLWMWLLATDAAEVETRAELAAFLASPPDAIGAWDLRLGRFVLEGGEFVEDFVAAGQVEVARRLEAGEALDDLMCEVYFYAGLGEWRRGAAIEDVAAYFQRSLDEQPLKWKWEWGFARVYLGGL